MSETKTENILEYVAAGTSARLDRAGSVIRGVKILGAESRNGRVYPKATMAAAVPMYENKGVYVDHPTKGDTAPRSYRDKIGSLQNVRLGESGLYADFYLNPKHPVAEQLLWDAEHAPENVGFSHNVEGKISKCGGVVTVEAIAAVKSVDLVADPATTKGLFESVQTDHLADAKRWIEAAGFKVSDFSREQLEALARCGGEVAAKAVLEARRRVLAQQQRRQRFDSFPTACSVHETNDFVAGVIGGLTFEEAERGRELLGLPSMNGRLRAFLGKIT